MTLLLAAAFAINIAAIWGILSFRKAAEEVAREQLSVRTRDHAHSLEAVLASRRDDLLFLSRSLPVSDTPVLLAAPDPAVAQRNRREVERSLLLFLAAHSDVERLVVRDELRRSLVAAGRHSGRPASLDATEFERPVESNPDWLAAMWPLGRSGGGGFLEAILSVQRLFSTATPASFSQLQLLQLSAAQMLPSGQANSSHFTATFPVEDGLWPAPIHWIVVGREPKSYRLGSVSALEGRYKLNILLNLVMLGLAMILGAIGFQQVKRTMALEVEKQQEARMRDLERQVMHRERLASVGQLAAGIAHEVNNPLEGMANYLGLLEEDIRAGRFSGTLDLVAQVREGVDRVAGITRRVLTFASPGGAQLEPLDIRDVLTETVAFVGGNPAFRHISVSWRNPEDSLVVLGNRITLGQLFLNLLINASQAQPDGGQIDVAAFRYDGQARVILADCGPGISPEILQRIFEPFFSTKGTTGLGLSVCHGIVTEHGGRIQAMNRVEGGTIFQVDIPILEGGAVAGSTQVS